MSLPLALNHQALQARHEDLSFPGTRLRSIRRALLSIPDYMLLSFLYKFQNSEFSFTSLHAR
jgi:hypothetical protein